MYLAPLYLPLLRVLILSRRLPLIRFDRTRGIVHLLRESRQLPIADVIAVCDVIAPPDDSESTSDELYELQLLLKTPASTEHLLLSGSWHHSALSPIASAIASRLGVLHLSINALQDTIVQERIAPNDSRI